MPTTYRFGIEADGRVHTTPGVDWEVSDYTKIEVVTFNPHSKMLVVKFPGRNVWASRGERRYEPAGFILFRVTNVEHDNDGIMVHAERVLDFGLREGHSDVAIKWLRAEADTTE